MNSSTENRIRVEVLVNATPEKAWNCMFSGEHIVNWNFASPDWHCPHAETDIRVGGKISSRMESRDGQFGFDFNCLIDLVEAPKQLHYHLEDGRKVFITFNQVNNQTQVIEEFDPENENPHEMQQMGWQAILTNYKNYTEGIK